MREPIVINAETREITVPETERAFGVAGERKVEVKHIRIEGRTVDGTDLTQGFTWKVSCENAGKELCADLIDGIVADAGNIEFDWIVGAAPMAYKGTMHFAVCAVRVDAAGNILQEWHSKLGTGDVANGIEATVQNIGGQDLLAHIQSITAAAQQNAAAAQRDAAAAAKSAQAAANSATAAKGSANAAAASAKAAASAVGATFYGVDFTGSTSAGTRTGAAAEFVFTPGTDTSAGQNDFDGVYPWAGMRRCCCTLNADGTVTVNAYKGQPGYIEDGTNGEVLVEVPLFYVSGMLDVNPRVSAVPMPGFRAPKKFQNADGSLKQKCYLPAFPGSIGSDGKLHSIAGVVSTGNKTISQFLAAARLWGETYCINTSADFEVLAYLMIVVYGTRNVQSKMRGVTDLYTTGIAVTGSLTDEAAVIVAKGVLEVGNVISIGTGSENESVANRRIVTAIEAIDGDTANVKASFAGEAVTTTTDHKIWRIMQSTGTANSVVSTCGSPVSNTDGRHSFVFYGVENPLYGNQWRFECDWKIVNGVPYICNDTNYNWSSVENYTKLDGLTLPSDGWAKNLQADERFPWLQITKEVGGSSGTYLADYFWINKRGSCVVLRGALSSLGDNAGAFNLSLSDDAGMAWWYSSSGLSIPG